jgi:SOS-response transcriptional repressor LexA
MTGIGQRIRDARERAGLTQQALGRLCGVSRAAVAQWESDTTLPSLSHLQRAADAPPGPRGRPVPVIDYVTAGNWDTVTDPCPSGRGVDALMTERRISANTFALIVRGTSMEPEFREGDKVIIDLEVTPLPGDFVVAKLTEEEEATLKK